MGGMTGLLLSLWVGVTVGTVVDLQKRINGGVTCKDTERLYHVKIIDENNDFFCGGSLISDRWILTAAHCWEWGMKAVIGVHPGKKPTIVEITAPPVMFGDRNNRIHDIMLLQLPDPVTHIQPVQLPDCGHPPKIGDAVQVAGHGATATEPDESSSLQCATMKVVVCWWLNPLQKGHPNAYQNMFCGQTPGVAICDGDSGGGVIYSDKIYGVAVDDDDDVCTREAGFMAVCEYKKWIEDTIKDTLFDKLKACLGCG